MRVLFSLAANLLIPAGEQYSLHDVSPDDQRFVMMGSVGEQEESELTVVQNWVEDLRARGGN